MSRPRLERRPRFRSARAPISVPADAELERDINVSAYRTALYEAWFATALEQTKSIFALGSAGVGLSMSMLFTLQPTARGSWAPVWLLLAGTMFAASAGACLWVLRENAVLVARLLRYEDAAKHERFVKRLDLASRLTFGAGLVLLLVAAVAHIWVDPGAPR